MRSDRSDAATRSGPVWPGASGIASDRNRLEGARLRTIVGIAVIVVIVVAVAIGVLFAFGIVGDSPAE
jgi:hypothetical protein